MLLVIYSNDLVGNIYTFDNSISGSYALEEFSCQNSFYNIHDNNNNLPFQQQSMNVVKVSLTNGFYNHEQLRSHLQSRLQTEISASLTVSFDTTTGKFTIEDPSATISFRLNDEDNTGCLDVIGFNSGGSYAVIQTGEKASNLTPYEDIYVEIEEAVNDAIHQKNFKVDTFIVPVENVDFGNVIRYKRKNDVYQFARFRGERSLNIIFRDKNRKPIQFNGADWKLVLEGDPRIK